MATTVQRTVKLDMPLQSPLLRYKYETKLVTLKENDGWNTYNGTKRGRLEIIAEILLFCGQQKAKTSIMYKANLNYSQLKKHLKSLTTQGLLTHNKDKYVTTEKGYRFLELFSQLTDMLSSFNM
jgi:predicted transcriptional regulator